MTDYLGKEYNKPINTDGMIRIYPDVTKKKKRHDQVQISTVDNQNRKRQRCQKE